MFYRMSRSKKRRDLGNISKTFSNKSPIKDEPRGRDHGLPWTRARRKRRT